ncbi:hypothetical protein B7494_g4611 [Chlorociboria aeruginascens]|nr:hypothetical protein B7494_g4611 [Chlorociboria aeruginascens]
MLLSKRLTTFLSNSTSPALHTLLLTTPSGKLLAVSSPSTAAILRTQATLASSLWTSYTQTSTSNLISSSLPSPQSSSVATSSPGPEISSILIQLEFGIMVIRMLKSGILFIAIGPTSTSSIMGSQVNTPMGSAANLNQQQINAQSPPASPTESEGVTSIPGVGLVGGGANSDTASLRTIGSHVSLLGLRRQVEEVAKALDGKFVGLSLSPS